MKSKLFYGIYHKDRLQNNCVNIEADGLIKREVFPEVPPRVEYSLTTKGREFIPVIDIMENFGKKYGEKSQ